MYVVRPLLIYSRCDIDLGGVAGVWTADTRHTALIDSVWGQDDVCDGSAYIFLFVIVYTLR